jgi:hypothetical protein
MLGVAHRRRLPSRDQGREPADHARGVRAFLDAGVGFGFGSGKAANAGGVATGGHPGE